MNHKAEDMDEEAYERELLEREYLISSHTPECGSPWYLGPMGGPDGGAEDYHRWRRYRDAFAATGDRDCLKILESCVSPDNPPLASDVKTDSDLRKWGLGDTVAVLIVAVFIIVLVLGMELI